MDWNYLLGFFNYFTRSAYLSVLSVFSLLDELGEILPIITVRQYPVKESLRTIVNLLPRNGVWCLFWSRARIHYLRASRLLFIYAPSILVCFYNWSAWSAARSLPARSINDIFPCTLLFIFSDICNIACERDESTFVPFWAVTRTPVPNSIICIKLSTFIIFRSERPTMFTLLFASYLDLIVDIPSEKNIPIV